MTTIDRRHFLGASAGAAVALGSLGRLHADEAPSAATGADAALLSRHHQRCRWAKRASR